MALMHRLKSNIKLASFPINLILDKVLKKFCRPSESFKMAKSLSKAQILDV